MKNGLTNNQLALLDYLSKQEVVLLSSSDAESYEGMEYEGKIVGAYSGYTCVDVSVDLKFKLGLFHVCRLLSNTFEWIKELPKATKKSYRYRSMWALREWAKFSCPELSPSPWIFVVDSIQTFRYDIASKSLGRPRGRTQADAIGQLAASYTNQDLVDYILNSHTKIGAGIYFCDSDPTCFVVDNALFPYDLKDGWSGKEIANFVALWLCYMGYGDKKVIWNQKSSQSS